MVYLAVIFLIIAIDQYTKSLVVKTMKVEETKKTRISSLTLWHKKNYGISYSNFSKYPDRVKIFTSIFTGCGYLMFLILLPVKGFRLLKLGVAMALGGASGNLIDRVRNNCVTDFIYIKGEHAPIFNIADLFIVVGAVAAFFAALKIKD